MAEKYELAEKDYQLGMKYKDIAAKYDVSINTVKSWKKRHNWQRGAPKEKRVHTKTQKVAPKIVEQLVNNDELTDKRKFFCLYYLQRFNATWAYMQAFNCAYNTARTNGAQLLANTDIQKQLKTLKEEIANDLTITATEIAQQYAKQAFADYGDYVDFGTEDVIVRDGWWAPVKDKLTHDYLTEKKSYVRLVDKDKVDTSLIKQVSIGRDGVKVELYDKQKAQSELLKYLKDQGDNNDDMTINFVRTDRRNEDADNQREPGSDD